MKKYQNPWDDADRWGKAELIAFFILLGALVVMFFSSCTKSAEEIEIKKPSQVDKDKAEVIWVKTRPKTIK